MVGNEKRMNPADFAGTDGAIEGQSPAEILQTWHPMLHELQKKPNKNK